MSSCRSQIFSRQPASLFYRPTRRISIEFACCAYPNRSLCRLLLRDPDRINISTEKTSASMNKTSALSPNSAVRRRIRRKPEKFVLQHYRTQKNFGLEQYFELGIISS